MITKAIVLGIDKNSNKINIRIPIFERAGNNVNINNNSIMQATLCYSPGTIGGINVNDIVYVGFEDNDLGRPVILGKLYINNNIGSTAKQCLSSIEVKDTAKLPSNTIIGDKSFTNILNKIKALETQLNQLIDKQNI